MCGVVGISSNESVATDIYDALTMLQHRGQDAAGIMTCHNGQFLQRKGEGLVKDVFQAKHMQQLGGTLVLAIPATRPKAAQGPHWRSRFMLIRLMALRLPTTAI